VVNKEVKAMNKAYQPTGNVTVNIDDLAPAKEIDKKFEQMSAKGAKEMAKNYGAPNQKKAKK
jgi:hypothetical protein